MNQRYTAVPNDLATRAQARNIRWLRVYGDPVGGRAVVQLPGRDARSDTSRSGPKCHVAARLARQRCFDATQ